MTEVFAVADLERVLWWTVSTGFTRHLIGPRTSPRVIVLARDWNTYVDVAHIRGIERAEVARIPRRNGKLNLYHPEVVVWHYRGGIADALRALMLLPSPSNGGPSRAYKPPRGQPAEPVQLSISPDELREVAMQLPDYHSSPPEPVTE
jgi:predicted GNAT family acetyltransferase